MTTSDNTDLKEYKNIETRFYGELMKICRRYTKDLNMISILGVLDIVSQEVKDLEKAGRSIMNPSLDGEPKEENLDSIM